MIHKYSKRFRTKRLIADQFAEMVVEMPLEEIHIHDLCDRCGISRHTFYYHFKDKYEIARWLHYAESRDAFECFPEPDPVMRYAFSLREVLQSRSDYYRRIFQYRGQNSLLYSLVNDTVMVYRTELMRYLNLHNVTPELQMLLYYHSYGTVMMIMEWIVQGSKLPAEQISKLIYDSLPDELRSISFRDSEDRVKPVMTTWEDVLNNT